MWSIACKHWETWFKSHFRKLKCVQKLTKTCFIMLLLNSFKEKIHRFIHNGDKFPCYSSTHPTPRAYYLYEINFTNSVLSNSKLKHVVMGKKSKNKDVTLEDEVKNITLEDQELTYDEKLKFVSVIAKPMATKSQAKKLYKLIKKASKDKGFIRSGLKDVQRRIRLGERGLCIFAGDVSPIDIMCHMPAVCEDKRIPYCYTPSRQDLGIAMGVKRGSVMVLIKPHESYQELYDEMFQELQTMPIPIDAKTDYIISQQKI